MANPQTKSKAIPRGIAGALIILAVAAAAWLLLDKCGRLPGDTTGNTISKTGEAVARVIKDVLQADPQIKTSSTIIHQGSQGTLEVALAEETFTIEQKFEHTWMRSTKVLQVRGTYIAKGGYKLEGDNWYVALKPDGSSMVMLPPPVVLSCEQTNKEILNEEEGWLNKLQPDERARLDNELQALARTHAAKGPLLANATTELDRRLREAAQRQPNLQSPQLQIMQSPPES